MAGRVAVLDPNGQFGTVDEADADAVVKAGGRVLTGAQIAQREAEQRQAAEYDATPTIGKIAGAVSTAAGALNPLMLGGAPGTAGAAYNRGVARGMTAGLSDAAIRAGVDAAAGKPAGAKFAQSLADQQTAHGAAFGAGELAGMAGSAALPLTPGGAINAAGTLAERGAGRLLAGAASKGALGRALATGGQMAARGATEAGIYSGVTAAADAVVKDEEITGSKLYAAAGHGALAGAVFGGALGFGGSLAGSAAKSLGAAAGKGLTAAMARAGAADGSGAARGAANDLAFDSLGTTRKIADKINARVEGGTTAVGEYVNRRIRAGQTAAEVARTSRADEILPLIQADKSSLGQAIGAEVKTYPVRVPMAEMLRPAEDLGSQMLKSPTQIQGATAFRQRVEQMTEALTNAGKIAPDGTISLSDMYYARSEMERVAHELGRGSAAHDTFKTYLRRVDDTLVGKLDEAAKAAGKDGSKLRSLKRDYQLAASAERAAEDGVNRIKGNNIFGLREAFLGASALGGAVVGEDPLSGAVAGAGLALGGRLLRQRGAAMAAKALTRAADNGMFARMLQRSDEAVAKASRGVLAAGAEKPPTTKAITVRRGPAEAADAKAEVASLRKQGQSVVEWVGQVRANPQRMMDALAEASAMMGERIGPRASAAYSASAMKSYMFIAKYVPEKERRDPLDPNSVPPLTLDEADKLVRAAGYATKPHTVWRDFRRGYVTPEGIDAAESLMPDQFQEFRLQLYSHVTDHMLRNKQLTQSQRLNVDKLLGIGFRPEDIARHQADFLDQPPAPAEGPQASPTGKPVNMKIQQSGFDSVTARMAG